MNIIYIDFLNKKPCSEIEAEKINKKHLIAQKYDRLNQLDKFIKNKLTKKQFLVYNKSENYTDKINSLKNISKSKKLNKIANEMNEILNEIN